MLGLQVTFATPGDICKYLAKEYQFMILKGKEWYRTVMNILNYGKNIEVTMSMIDEIFKLMNESMPHQKLAVPRSDTSDIPDCDEIDSESFKWYEVGKIICMLQKLENDPESPVLGKLCSSICRNCYT